MRREGWESQSRKPFDRYAQICPHRYISADNSRIAMKEGYSMNGPFPSYYEWIKTGVCDQVLTERKRLRIYFLSFRCSTVGSKLPSDFRGHHSQVPWKEFYPDSLTLT